VGVRASYLASTFRRCYGCSVRDYVRRLRLEYACRELERSHSSLLEISAAAGFCDNSHFSRIFKEAFGTSPGAYRRSSQLARTG
jgi:AraC family transcriptional regulator